MCALSAMGYTTGPDNDSYAGYVVCYVRAFLPRSFVDFFLFFDFSRV